MKESVVTFDSLYRRLLAAFGPHKDPSLEDMRKAEYEKGLEDIPLEILSKIIDSAVQHAPAFPTIGQIRRMFEGTRGARQEAPHKDVTQEMWEDMVETLTPEQFEELREQAYQEMDLASAESLGKEICDLMLKMRMLAKYKGLV